MLILKMSAINMFSTVLALRVSWKLQTICLKAPY